MKTFLHRKIFKSAQPSILRNNNLKSVPEIIIKPLNPSKCALNSNYKARILFAVVVYSA